MPKDLKDLKEIERDELALAPPRMRILNDRPLSASEAHLDSLRLAAKLAPVYDILRHPDTQTPLAVAIYGDWGTGKTSAMKWLEGLLNEWNDEGDHDHGRPVHPVWFYPWKYHKKEDVWRGLIAEVILASIDIRGATLERIKSAIKRFGLFLGRSFLHALSSVKLTAGVSVSTGALQDIYKDYNFTAHPEEAYLNEFETTLSTWVKDTISDADERMVVFIDDLDRCLPEVALQVLEALKLYLNIEDLIFVVGVDRTVIDQLIQKLYGDFGLEQQKSKKYLAKMFQIEVSIGPSDQQAEAFIDEQLAVIGAYEGEYWTKDLEESERQLFRDVVLRLAQRNPREMKRLLNSALIHGAGVQHLENRPFSFAQGMQVFLVRRVLDERYTMGLSVDTKAGMQFFHRWSAIVRNDAAPVVPNPEEMARLLGSQLASAEDNAETEKLQSVFVAGRRARVQIPETPYDELLTNPRFAHLRRLLSDRDLGELMRIEYPADTSALAESYVQDLPQGLIREAIAGQLRKSPADLNASDYGRVLELDLNGQEIVDISPLQALAELRSLDLSFTQVADLAPIARLTKLESLHLGSTPVAELASLRRLEQLRTLNLSNTQVSDLEVLRHLTELRSLTLIGAPIDDIGALRSLGKLERLTLVNTQVVDLTPLQALTSLQALNLSSNPIADLVPLAGMSALLDLFLADTETSNLAPLASLGQLRTLSLKRAPVTDLSPLHGLQELQFVHLQGIAASAEAIGNLRNALPNTEITT